MGERSRGAPGGRPLEHAPARGACRGRRHTTRSLLAIALAVCVATLRITPAGAFRVATGKATRAQTPPSSGTKTRIASLATDQAVAPAGGFLPRERTPDAAPEGKEQGRAEGPAKARRNRLLLPMPRGKGAGGAGRNSTGGMTQVRHTVDLYVPPRDLEVMMAVAERLERRLSQPTSLARVDVREQRLLALAQAYLWLERKRMELAQGKVRETRGP